MSSKEHVFIATRHNGKPAVSLHMIEYAVAKSDPINFDIYGYRARYVPERTCKLEKVHDWNDEWEPFGFVCGECEEALPRYYGSDNFGHVTLPNYCPHCGAKVVE